MPKPEPPRPCTRGWEPGTALGTLESALGREGSDKGVETSASLSGWIRGTPPPDLAGLPDRLGQGSYPQPWDRRGDQGRDRRVLRTCPGPSPGRSRGFSVHAPGRAHAARGRADTDPALGWTRELKKEGLCHPEEREAEARSREKGLGQRGRGEQPRGPRLTVHRSEEGPAGTGRLSLASPERRPLGCRVGRFFTQSHWEALPSPRSPPPRPASTPPLALSPPLAPPLTLPSLRPSLNRPVPHSPRPAHLPAPSFSLARPLTPPIACPQSPRHPDSLPPPALCAPRSNRPGRLHSRSHGPHPGHLNTPELREGRRGPETPQAASAELS